jgi:glutaredoxin-like protein NrdH
MLPLGGMVRLYGIPGCGPCEIVKMFLERNGVPYEFVNAKADPEAAKKIAELVGGPTAGVVLEWQGRLEAVRGVSPQSLNAWLARYRESA